MSLGHETRSIRAAANELIPGTLTRKETNSECLGLAVRFKPKGGLDELQKNSFGTFRNALAGIKRAVINMGR